MPDEGNTIKMLNTFDGKIDRLDDKMEKVRDKIINPKVMFSIMTVFISVLSWACIQITNINDKVAVHTIKIENITEQLRPLKDSIYGLTNSVSMKPNAKELELVKKFLKITRKDKIILEIYKKYGIEFENIDTAILFILNKIKQ